MTDFWPSIRGVDVAGRLSVVGSSLDNSTQGFRSPARNGMPSVGRSIWSFHSRNSLPDGLRGLVIRGGNRRGRR